MNDYPLDKKRLLYVADGPECIEIYTSEDQGVCDMAQTFPALYLRVSMNEAAAQFGPFTLRSIHEGVEKALAKQE